MIFPIAENNEKKKLVQKFGNLLLHNSYCEGEIVLQDLEVYSNRKACWKGNELERLYCNRLGGLAVVLQYNCD